MMKRYSRYISIFIAMLLSLYAVPALAAAPSAQTGTWRRYEAVQQAGLIVPVQKGWEMLTPDTPGTDSRWLEVFPSGLKGQESLKENQIVSYLYNQGNAEEIHIYQTNDLNNPNIYMIQLSQAQMDTWMKNVVQDVDGNRYEVLEANGIRYLLTTTTEEEGTCIDAFTILAGKDVQMSYFAPAGVTSEQAMETFTKWLTDTRVYQQTFTFPDYPVQVNVPAGWLAFDEELVQQTALWQQMGVDPSKIREAMEKEGYQQLVFRADFLAEMDFHYETSVREGANADGQFVPYSDAECEQIAQQILEGFRERYPGVVYADDYQIYQTEQAKYLLFSAQHGSAKNILAITMVDGKTFQMTYVLNENRSLDDTDYTLVKQWLDSVHFIDIQGSMQIKAVDLSGSNALLYVLAGVAVLAVVIVVCSLSYARRHKKQQEQANSQPPIPTETVAEAEPAAPVGEQPLDEQMHCPHCQMPAQAGERFCAHCGQALGPDTPEDSPQPQA